MKIILVCQKEEFDKIHLQAVEKHTEVIWFDSDNTNLEDIPELFDSEEKILALSPVPLQWNLPIKLYKRFVNVRYICLPTTSYEFIDLDECKDNGIIVTNVPHYATKSVAEQAIMMLFSLAKKVPEQIKSNFKYEFSEKVLGDDLFGKKVGIIGMGDIGKMVAKNLSGLGISVSYWSPKKKDLEFEFCENLNELLAKSDIILPFVVANKDTFGMLDREKLCQIKDTAYFVGLIDDRVWDKSYLLERIKQNKLSGLAFESEKEDLRSFEGNVFILPPFAWYSKQSLNENIEVWAETIISCIKERPINKL